MSKTIYYYKSFHRDTYCHSHVGLYSYNRRCNNTDWNTTLQMQIHGLVRLTDATNHPSTIHRSGSHGESIALHGPVTSCYLNHCQLPNYRQYQISLSLLSGRQAMLKPWYWLLLLWWHIAICFSEARWLNKLNKVEEWVKNIRHWMLNIFLLHNSHKIKILLLGPQAARNKLCDYVVTLDGLLVK